MVRLLTLYFITIFFCVSFCTSCAYHFGNRDRSIPGGYTQVAVPVFSNKTNEVGVETYFTNAMIEELMRSNLATVTSKSDAQVVLEGTVASVSVNPTVQKATDTGELKVKIPRGPVLNSTFQVVVVSNIVLKRLSDNKVLWTGSFSKERTFEGSQIAAPVLNSMNPLYNQSAKHETYKIIARDMMAEAESRMTENF